MELTTVTPRDEDNVRRDEKLAIWQWRAHQLAAARPLAAHALTFAARVDSHEVAERAGIGRGSCACVPYATRIS
jgi:hypothetical protein